MTDSLTQLIHDYQAAVRTAIALLEGSGISRPATPFAWVLLRIPQSGELSGGVHYFKHGYGCTVYLPFREVDFDFGKEGQIDGFDLWRLVDFAKDRLNTYGFTSEQDVKAAFQAAVKSGKIEPLGKLFRIKNA